MGGEPVDDVDVKTGDGLYYVNSDGNHCVGDVTKVTDRFVTLGRDGWDMDQGRRIPVEVKLRRAEWPLHHVRIVRRAEMLPTPLPHAGASQAFPEPPRPDSPRASSTESRSTPPTAQQMRRPASR